MYDALFAIKRLFLGLAGLVLTLAYRLYVGLLAWRSLRKNPAFEGVRFWPGTCAPGSPTPANFGCSDAAGAFCNVALAAAFAARQI